MSTGSSPQCPRCADATPLERGSLRGVEIRLCRACRGILIARSDLEAIIAAARRRARRHTGEPVDYFARLRQAAKFRQTEAHLACPQCRYNMLEVESHGVVVDFCLNCGVLWFDEGELRGTLARARQTGAVDLVPAELDGNDTAQLIHWLLEQLPGAP